MVWVLVMYVLLADESAYIYPLQAFDSEAACRIERDIQRGIYQGIDMIIVECLQWSHISLHEEWYGQY